MPGRRPRSDPRRQPRGESICAQLTDTVSGIYAFADLQAEPRFAGNSSVDGRRATVRGYASAPLTFGGATVGTLCVFDSQPVTLTPSQCNRLAALADLTTTVVHAHALKH